MLQINDVESTITVTITDNIGSNHINYNLFRDTRLKKKYHLSHVAKKAGKSSSTVARYERGECLPRSWFILKALCMELSLPPDDLLDLKNAPNDPRINVALLRKYRKFYNKLSIRDVSNRLGLHPTTEKDYEHQETVPISWIFLKQLCVILGVSANDVLGLSISITHVKNVELFTAIYNYLDK